MRALALSTCLVLALSQGIARAEPQGLDRQLLNAVMSFDGPSVTALLAKGAQANTVDNNRSLLGWAAQNGGVGIVESLLAAGADPNFVDGVGHTPLMRAVEMHQIEVVKVLLGAKPDLAIRTRDGKTIAIMAVETGKPELVRLLLDAGTDFNAADGDGSTPALLAAQGGGEEMYAIIEMLGEYKVDMNGSNAAYTALTYALQQDNPQLVAALLKAGADPNRADAGGGLPLAKAISDAKPDPVRQLLEAGANPNAKDGRGDPLLFEALRSGSVDTVNALLDGGADPSAKDSSGRTPLEYAEGQYLPEMAATLKARGAGVPEAAPEVSIEAPVERTTAASGDGIAAMPKLAEVQAMGVTGAELNYFSSASVRELAEFYRKAMQAAGWRQGEAYTDELNYAVIGFNRDGSYASLSLSLDSTGKPARVMVNLIDHGSLAVSTLPRYAGTKTLSEQANIAIYLTPDKPGKVGKATLKLLQAAGWQGETKVQNDAMSNFVLRHEGYELDVFVSVAPAQGNKTTIQYSVRKL